MGVGRVSMEIVWDGPRVTRLNRERARAGLWRAMEELLRRANERVPLDEGTLLGSGKAFVTDGLTGIVSYDTPYAVRLHEHPEYNFQGGREGKWLERTVNESAPEIIRYLAEHLKL